MPGTNALWLYCLIRQEGRDSEKRLLSVSIMSSRKKLKRACGGQIIGTRGVQLASRLDPASVENLRHNRRESNIRIFSCNQCNFFCRLKLLQLATAFFLSRYGMVKCKINSADVGFDMLTKCDT